MLWWKTFPDGYIFGEEGFFTQPGYLPRQYPLYVARAFLSVDYDEPLFSQDEPEQPWYRLAWEAAEAFSQRWGGFDEATLQLVLHQGPLPDQLAAVFALGHSSFPGANDSLAPLLHSNDWLLRGAAACCLVLRRDERAIPVIERYLLTPAPTLITHEGLLCPVPPAQLWYEKYKALVAWVLAEWGPPSLVPVFRQALLQTWHEEQDPEELYSPWSREFYEALCYALGRRGVLGALHGIQLPELLRRHALRLLALGYLRVPERFDDSDWYSLLQHPDIRKEITILLKDKFGMEDPEIQKIFDSAWDDLERFDFSWRYPGDSDNAEENAADETLRLAAELARASRQHQEPPDQSPETAQP
ncbi:HEAT repeat domain-containing protein [Thermogemmatispora sp.]|uniref:HEAT repeat domain-containing protein n=1 Tax=Thermogemmatispora sp. TaxID=1968838 RepID=UPI0035E46726